MKGGHEWIICWIIIQRVRSFQAVAAVELVQVLVQVPAVAVQDVQEQNKRKGF